MLSQRRLFSRGVIWQSLGALKTSLAAAFCTRCSFSRRQFHCICQYIWLILTQWSHILVFCFCLLEAFSLNIDILFINLCIYEMWICTLSFWYLCKIAEILPNSRQGFGHWDFDISMRILARFQDLCSQKLTKSASFITSRRDSQFSFWPLRSLDNTAIFPAKKTPKYIKSP